jgi:oxygen-dependent protoporphyrinogen oxidase
MLGALNPEHREVTVVGAGIAGLLMADALDRQGYKVTLLEAGDRAGGVIRTTMTPWGPAESAAHSIQATPAVLDLCRELGVELVSVRPESRARYVWRRGQLRRFPLTVWEALRAFARAYAVLAEPSVSPESLTLEQWGRHFLGEPALRYLLTPFVRGIYGARPSEINVSMAFPSLTVPRGHSLISWMLRRWHLRLRGKGEPRRARPAMMAPRGGMGALTGALEKRLRERLGERFRTGSRVVDLPRADNLVLCVPAPDAARLLASADPALSAALTRVDYSPLVTVTAFVERSGFAALPRGVGVLLPDDTSRQCLGILFNSSSFPGRVADESRWVSLTAMLGGSVRPELLRASDEEIRTAVRSDLEAILGLAPGAKIETVIHRWERAVPQYNGRLAEAWEMARGGWCSKPGQVIFGNYAGQVSVRGMIETVVNSSL